MSLVLDNSATIAWVYAEETTEAIVAVFRQVASEGAWVPSLWRLEVANVLHSGIRKRRHTRAFRDQTLDDLARLPIVIDAETELHAWHSTVLLADMYGLTPYDAAYLELALRRGLPLATLDEDLRVAAVSEGVLLLGL